MEADFEEDCKFIVESNMFGNIIKKLPTDTVTLDIFKDENKIKISSGNYSTKIALGNISDYPELPTVDTDSEFTINSKILSSMISKTAISLSIDQTKPILTGALLEIENNSFSMVSLDGYRMSVCKESFETGIKESSKIVVSGRALSIVSSLIGSNDLDISMSFGKNFISTSFEGMTYTARLLEGEFIDYTKLLPKEFNTVLKANRKDLLAMIDRASSITISEKNNLIKLAVSDNLLQVVSNSDKGDSADYIDIEKTGDSLNIAFNSKYLMDVLKIMNSEETNIKFINNVSPCIIDSSDDDSFLYLLLPVRVSNASK